MYRVLDWLMETWKAVNGQGDQMFSTFVLLSMIEHLNSSFYFDFTLHSSCWIFWDDYLALARFLSRGLTSRP